MRRVGVVAFASLGVGLMPTFAAAQSVDIPLNYTVNTRHNYGEPINNALILTINVGVGGAPAQPYAFDTGSSVFVARPGTFTSGNSTLLATTSSLEDYSGNTFTGNIYQVPASAFQFYATPGATTGGITLSTTGSYNVGSYIDLNSATPPPRPFGTAAVGVFGATGIAFDNNMNSLNTGIRMGGILGQAVTPDATTAGFIVSANGQSLAALNAQLGTSIAGGPVTGAAQSIQTVPAGVTSCNPCLTVGLTPALLAQFLPVNTVDAPGNGVTFGNSNTPGIDKFPPIPIRR